MSTHERTLIITGPTASGKTAMAEKIAQNDSGEIINIDVGQFYTPLTVGTAKPEWKNKPFMCHMFDILDNPVELSVAAYRANVIMLVEEILKRGKRPIIVGGSMFYIKSLFYPPHEYPVATCSTRNRDLLDFPEDKATLWDRLNEIDSVRARALHPNDHYRIVRALQIWEATGQKPSQLQPIFTPPFPAHIVFLMPSKDVLSERINQRTRDMVMSGDWVNEARNLLDTEWERFIELKGIIGYKQIFEYLRSGSSDQDAIIPVMENIACQTRQYAKRQMVFAKKFQLELDEQSKLGVTTAIVTQNS